MNNFKKQKILTHNVNVISTIDLLKEVKKFLVSQSGEYICITPVHAITEAYNNKNFANIVNNASLSLPDGRPVYWALKLLKHKNAEYLPGYYVTKKLCEYAAHNNIKVGFYGGKQETLEKCIKNLKMEFEKLDIRYTCSPPFRELSPEEKNKITKEINQSDIQLLFVCLGCPKQEYWMSENKENIKCTKVGIGAAIEFISGDKYLPPYWIQQLGLFWIFRLFVEPKRLFKRYFFTNFKFIYLFLKQYFKL